MSNLLIDPQVYPDGRAYTAIGADGVLNKAQTEALVSASAVAITANMLAVQDEKASGTSGGNGTGATWNTRDLNTVLVDNIPGASVSANQITLPAGTYWIDSDAPAHTNDAEIYSKLRFRNITDAVTEVLGTQLRINGDSVTNIRLTNEVFAQGEFTIADTKVFELQQWLSTTASATLGIAVSTGENEVYARIKIWKTA